MQTLIPTVLPKEITDKYIVSGNTFIQMVKDDPKDRIETEIGDIKQTDFLPQIKIKRWDNEVNCSVRLKHNETNPTITTEGNKIKWQGDKIEAHFYDLSENEIPEGGYEFEVILKEKPVTNKIEFTLNAKGLDFFYQPELTQKEADNGCFRPENIVGSYAVYCSEQKINWVGGKFYRVGKFGHIYRPKIIDSIGNWVWGILKIENDTLSIEIPQSFLDTAVYPIRHASGTVLGYNTAGGSPQQIGNFDGSYYRSYRIGEASTPAGSGNISNLNASVSTNMAAATNGITSMLVNQKDSGGSGVHGKIGGGEATISYPTTKNWRQIASLSIGITEGITYILSAIVNSANLISNKYFYIYYDIVTSIAYYTENWADLVAVTAYNNALEDPWTKASSGTTIRISIYANYTPVGGGIPNKVVQVRQAVNRSNTF